MEITATTDADTVLDMESVDADIAAGAKAFKNLMERRTDDWTDWSIIIRGLRALRNLCFAESQTSNIKAWAYRQAMGGKLQMRKYAIYDQIDKQTRSDCYKLMDAVEDISTWYAGLPAADQLRWKHPTTIAKHCPKQYVSGMRGHNQPKKIAKKPKPIVSAEIERLKALLISVIKRLAKHEPDALDLLDQISPVDPNDRLDDLDGLAAGDATD